MYQVYALYNKNCQKIYIGQTQDLKTRLDLHNKKSFNGSFTSRFDGNWILIYKELCQNRNSAIKREKQLKSHQGRLFIKKFIPL